MTFQDFYALCATGHRLCATGPYVTTSLLIYNTILRFHHSSPSFIRSTPTGCRSLSFSANRLSISVTLASMRARIGFIRVSAATTKSVLKKATKIADALCAMSGQLKSLSRSPSLAEQLLGLDARDADDLLNLPNSAGEPGSISAPRFSNWALSLGSASPALISRLSVSIMSAGVFFGRLFPASRSLDNRERIRRWAEGPRKELRARRARYRQATHLAALDLLTP